MKRETPFKLAAKSTLRVTERDFKDKTMLNTLKAGSDLHRELTKVFNQKERMQIIPQQTRTFIATQ